MDGFVGLCRLACRYLHDSTGGMRASICREKAERDAIANCAQHPRPDAKRRRLRSDAPPLRRERPAGVASTGGSVPSANGPFSLLCMSKAVFSPGEYSARFVGTSRIGSGANENMVETSIGATGPSGGPIKA